jgi:N-acetylmuramoyl-L-alanine amidase
MNRINGVKAGMSDKGPEPSAPKGRDSARFGLPRLVLLMAAAMLAVLAGASDAALARDDTGLVAQELRIAGDATRARFLLEFDAEPTPRWFLLRNPHRLVIDLPETEFEIEASQAEPRGLVSRFQHGQLGIGTSRLIISSDGPFVIDHIDVTENADSLGFRLVVDMVAASDREFEAALAEQIATTGSTQHAKDRSPGRPLPEARSDPSSS